MDGLLRGMDWVLWKIRRLPVEHKESFARDSGADNLVRLRLLSMVLVAFSLFFFIKPDVFGLESRSVSWSPFLVNSVYLLIVLSTLIVTFLLSRNVFRFPVWLIRIPVISFSVLQLWWACYMGSLMPLELNPAIFFTISVFVVYSTFILSIAEAVGILLNGLLAFYWFNTYASDSEWLTLGVKSTLGLFLMVAFLVSRVVFYSRVSSFLNWENISSMNSSLKWEIKNHQQTLKELEAIRNDLDRQVSEKTSFLRETNQRLQEEIAERGFADKVKAVLYRISGYVNQNSGLQETFHNIHEQLRQILDVTNFMVGTYDSERLEITPVYQDNSTESFNTYRLGRTLSSYVIRHKKSLLVNKKGIKDLVLSGDVEIVGVMADSWLGVPLMIEERVVGLLMVQSYKHTVIYDNSDQQLLEYVGEHMALAIDRYDVQSKLIQAKEQAEQSDRLKSAFLSNLSHEIRTPLNSILGFTEVMADPDFTDTQRQQYTSQVIDNGHRLLNTLTKMIELAKLQSNQMSMQIEDLEVGNALLRMRDEISPMLCISNKTNLEIRIACDPSTEKLTFRADFTRFKQMVLCLAENAIKFTEQGFMEIGCCKYDQRQLLFWVKDSGIGMNSDELNHIFEWFIKGQRASEDFYQGTGLGLTITKLIVELMNGQIWAESEPGQGSSFFFTLPAILPDSIQMIPDSRIIEDFSVEEQSVHAV
jgi:signal transduction histidine kinase